jgi:hypothetical protein
MTSNAELIAIGITKIRAIVMGMVLGPQTWFALTSASAGQSQCMDLVNLLSRTGQEGNHLPIACLVRLLVEGTSDDKQRPRIWR